MPVKQTIPYNYGTFVITFTCYQWLRLIEKVNGYDIVYNWFDYLKKSGHFINAYVIMPDPAGMHVHIMISFAKTGQNISTIIDNGKRFMAYEIVKRLKEVKEVVLLNELSEAVDPARKENNKKHDVWELSFDWKECRSDTFIDQKLNYMHNNPCSKKWDLCKTPVDYLLSSAKFYITGEQGIYQVTNVADMKDIVLYRRD